MDAELARRIAYKMEKLLIDPRCVGRAMKTRQMVSELVDSLGGEHYVPTVRARRTAEGRYRVDYCPYCHKRHWHTSDTTRHTASCGGGEYDVEVGDG